MSDTAASDIRYNHETPCPFCHNHMRQNVTATSSPKKIRPSAICARRNERASPSSTGARVLEVSPVEIVMSVITAEPKSVQPPALASEVLARKKPSASKTNDEEVSAIVK